jgi:glycosyltransferase involved in cell wall biosynthesis
LLFVGRLPSGKGLFEAGARMSEVKVSVCIPVYGAEAYIACCARSLFEQTMQEGLEFIFVDDASPDKSFEVLAATLADYPARRTQVRVIHLPHNRGVAYARKVAMRAATGRYVIHCDPDDWVAPTLYATLYARAEALAADMVYCDYVRFFSQEDQRPVRLEALVDRDEMLRRFLYRQLTATCLWNKLYRRACLADVDLDVLSDEITYGEDFVLNVMLLRQCTTIAKVDEALYFYRDVPHSITARLKSNRRLQRNIYQMQLAFEMFLSDPVYHEAMESSRRFALYTAISSGVISAQQWQTLWPSAKRGMWHDKRWNWAQKLIFFAARVNFTLTSFCFKVLTGRLKK